MLKDYEKYGIIGITGNILDETNIVLKFSSMAKAEEFAKWMNEEVSE
jgi:hypothetical protein